MNSPNKGPVSWKMFPFDDDIIYRLVERNFVQSSTAKEINKETYLILQLSI